MEEQQLSTRRQLELMQKLQQAADMRASLEVSIATTRQTQVSTAEEEKRNADEQLEQQYTRRRRELENEFAAAKSSASQQCRQAIEENQQNCDLRKASVEKKYKQSSLSIERKKKESEWQALAVFDAAKDGPQLKLDEAAKRLHARVLQVDGLQRDAYTLLAMRRLTEAAQAEEENTAAAVNDAPEEASQSSAEDRLQQTISRLHQGVLDLQSQRLPSILLEGTRPFGWCVFACVLAILPVGFLTGWNHWVWPPGALLAGAIISGVGYLLLGRRAQRQSLQQFSIINGLLSQCRTLEQDVRDEAQTQSRQEAEKITLAKHRDLAAAQDERQRAMEVVEARRAEDLEQIQLELEAAVEQAKAERNRLLEAADEQYPPLIDQHAEDRQSTAAQYESRFRKQLADAQSAHEFAWNAMAEDWRQSFQEIADELRAMQLSCEQLFPDWSTTQWNEWTRPETSPPAIQFGQCQLPLQAVKNGLSEDERLQPEQRQLDLPALMTLDEHPGLVISASGAGRAAAVQLMQAAMLRFLTAMPAGKLRFTIVDPTALGDNFATFMHLADYDEQLIGGRIWTDGRQIDGQLGLLSDHMEKVLQKYLRNEFETIHEYNQHAGEVSEPYHVLVVANFPSGLTDNSIRRLMTIANTGPRCGVYTLLSIDEQQKLPNEFRLDPLLADKVHLRWVEDRLVWQYPLFEKLNLQLDRLPPRDKLNDILREAGLDSREASRVEVPFEVVAPSQEDVWSGTTAHELVVPIGRAGANEHQSVRLGRGTSQHMLIAGKTGSGKSTLLHALITNAALHYSPAELELYLIDFKKGVEFKAYATGELPHARVIAIESEREFGVSVLQRLDDELRRRGELFRELGVQDLAGYRGQRPSANGHPRTTFPASMPRVLLVVDEFQELFVTDDKLSQDAALLLDRLVRQGRAFGIHVLLGSQTLAGAYSLARSTLGQMAVRIALECSDADAHLILSDENTAARLLSRPGEAIYNDQNGMTEGNTTFQVVWLPDESRQEYLADIQQRHKQNGFEVEPAIVFEGNVPADPRDNEALNLLFGDVEAQEVAEPTIWLGSAVRIEPPTQITLRDQGGNHVLIVGHDEPSALGMLTTSVAALAAQPRGEQSAFTILDGTRPDSADEGAWTAFASALPCTANVYRPREAAGAVASLAEEVSRRTQVPDQQYAHHYLIIHDLAQFRDLRQSEDDFGFMSSSSNGTNGKAQPVDKRFRDLLREGPAVGVHVLVWCDSHNSLTRFIDRLTMREFDFRVALQMSSVDSTSLIDSPAASRLGEHRAILYRDDLGTQVKFRPYRRPAADWTAWVGEQLTRAKLTRSK